MSTPESPLQITQDIMLNARTIPFLIGKQAPTHAVFERALTADIPLSEEISNRFPESSRRAIGGHTLYVVDFESKIGFPANPGLSRLVSFVHDSPHNAPRRAMVNYCLGMQGDSWDDVVMRRVVTTADDAVPPIDELVPARRYTSAEMRAFTPETIFAASAHVRRAFGIADELPDKHEVGYEESQAVYTMLRRGAGQKVE